MATGTSSRASSPAFHADDPEQTIEYRSLSVPAIIGLAVRLGVAAVFRCAAAAADSDRRGSRFRFSRCGESPPANGALAGRWAAIAGLDSVCRDGGRAHRAARYVIRTMRSQQSQDFATDWLQNDGCWPRRAGVSPDGRFRARPRSRRPGSKDDARQAPYDTVHGLAARESAVRRLGQMPTSASSARSITTHKSFQHVFVRQKFEVTPAATNGDAHPVDVTLTMQRDGFPKKDDRAGSSGRWTTARSRPSIPRDRTVIRRATWIRCCPARASSATMAVPVEPASSSRPRINE